MNKRKPPVGNVAKRVNKLAYDNLDSYKDVAEVIGASEATAWAKLQNKYQFTANELICLANYYKVSTDYILFGRRMYDT